jgi:hypothetical protein
MGGLLIAKSSRGVVEKGDIWEVRHHDSPLSPKEAESYIFLKIPDRLMIQLDSYQARWFIALEWEVVAHQASTDGYRIRAWCKTASAGGVGSLTRAMVENYLDNWNAIVQSAQANEVVFDFSIYGLVTSNHFWNAAKIDVPKTVWTELDYDEVTGIHRVSGDYSALGNNPAFIERRIHQAIEDAVIISHDSKVLVFEIRRTSVLAHFKKEIQTDFRKTKIKQRRYRLASAAVDNIIAQGGVVEYDFATVAAYLQDKMMVK